MMCSACRSSPTSARRAMARPQDVVWLPVMQPDMAWQVVGAVAKFLATAGVGYRTVDLVSRCFSSGAPGTAAISVDLQVVNLQAAGFRHLDSVTKKK